MILAVGDTHQNPEAITAILTFVRELKPDILVHTGDHYQDYMELATELNIPCYGVPGNCDPDDHPQELIFSFGGKKVLLVHGHQYGVKLELAALIRRGKAREVNLIIFGHTHQPLVDTQQDILLVNPGSLTWPRGGSLPSIATIELCNSKMTAKIHNLDISFFKKMVGLFKTVF